MAVHKLLLEDCKEETYKLIAVHCRLEAYRLAYVLNRDLKIKLKRERKDLEIAKLKTSYPLFEWRNNNNDVVWNLISNTSKSKDIKANNSGLLFQDETEEKINYLISNFKNVDYFIKISNENTKINEVPILKTLNNLPQIITSYGINSNKIKLKDYLIF